ncbi:hypothetical protein C8R43DRAFT_1234254 [Mycena crocata]|nr:hypothetical protein C8R43DRAFT_1234254 [Mycena crocata]
MDRRPVFQPRVCRISRCARPISQLIRRALCIVIVSLVTKPSHRDEWYYIVMPIILSIGACSCAYNSWRCWKLHKSDGQNFIPMPLSSQV